MLLPFVLQVLPLLQPCLKGQSESSCPILLLCQAESTRAVKVSNIQIGDTVLVRQPKREKLSAPYHPTPLTVTKKHHSMLTAESADRKVTRNSSHFKKLLADDSTTFSTSQFLGGATVDLDTESSPPSSIPVSVQESTDSPVGPGGNAEILTETVCGRSTCVSVPPETHSRDLMMIHSFMMILNTYLRNILYAIFKVIQTLICGHCLRIMNFESVRIFSS